MVVPQGGFVLERHPARAKSTLRAWDAADEYLLGHLAEHPPEGRRWVLVNDAFGALAVALADKRPEVWADSELTHRGLAANLERNGRHRSEVPFVASTTPPDGGIDVVVIKLPRTLASLEHQLHVLRPLLAPGATVVAGAMSRHVHRSTLAAVDGIIGATRTSLAWKKARLVFAELDPSLEPGPSPYPVRFVVDGGIEVVSHASVFAHDRLDIGTRLLLEQQPGASAAAVAVDLGCGNGVLGTALALANRDSVVHFRDVSYAAIASAEATAGASGVDIARCRFQVADGIGDLPAGSVDLVVNNPPFHEDHAVGDAVAWQMFTESHRALRSGGHLWVVGNRHLGYHTKLNRLFGRSAVTVVAADPKFVVLRAERA